MEFDKVTGVTCNDNLLDCVNNFMSKYAKVSLKIHIMMIGLYEIRIIRRFRERVALFTLKFHPKITYFHTTVSV